MRDEIQEEEESNCLPLDSFFIGWQPLFVLVDDLSIFRLRGKVVPLPRGPWRDHTALVIRLCIVYDEVFPVGHVLADRGNIVQVVLSHLRERCVIEQVLCI